MRKNQGFTLIEVMIVIIIISILVAIAMPTYHQYLMKKDLAIAKQEALTIASELERFKSKNFSYKDFDPTHLYPTFDQATGTLSLPVGAAVAKYTLTLVDGDKKQPLNGSNVTGLSWAISVLRVKDNGIVRQPQNYDVLVTSKGVRCISQDQLTIEKYMNCGLGQEDW